MADRSSVETTGTYEVNARKGKRITHAELLAARPEAGLDGKHAWVINLIHRVDDPFKEVDDLELGHETLFGWTPVHCYFCGATVTDNGPTPPEVCRPEDSP